MRSKVIIVEDDTSVRQALRLLFKAAGFEVIAFASAGAFIESGHYDTGDCIITDLCMPCVTGFDLLERLQARGNTIPVIVVTSSGGPANRERARRLGAKAFFGKPVDGHSRQGRAAGGLKQHSRGACGL